MSEPTPLEIEIRHQLAEAQREVEKWKGWHESARLGGQLLATQLTAAQAELQRRHDALAKAFGQPRGEDGKCVCAYCRRDFEAIAEHAALMEMDVVPLKEQLEATEKDLAQHKADNEQLRKDFNEASRKQRGQTFDAQVAARKLAHSIEAYRDFGQAKGGTHYDLMITALAHHNALNAKPEEKK